MRSSSMPLLSKIPRIGRKIPTTCPACHICTSVPPPSTFSKDSDSTKPATRMHPPLPGDTVWNSGWICCRSAGPSAGHWLSATREAMRGGSESWDMEFGKHDHRHVSLGGTHSGGRRGGTQSQQALHGGQVTSSKNEETRLAGSPSEFPQCKVSCIPPRRSACPVLCPKQR